MDSFYKYREFYLYKYRYDTIKKKRIDNFRIRQKCENKAMRRLSNDRSWNLQNEKETPTKVTHKISWPTHLRTILNLKTNTFSDEIVTATVKQPPFKVWTIHGLTLDNHRDNRSCRTWRSTIWSLPASRDSTSIWDSSCASNGPPREAGSGRRSALRNLRTSVPRGQRPWLLTGCCQLSWPLRVEFGLSLHQNL